MKIDELPTPALLIDGPRLEANLATMARAGPGERLRVALGGENAEDHGDIRAPGHGTQAPGGLLADVLEVRRLAPDDAPQRDDRVVPAPTHHPGGGLGQFPGARDPVDVDVPGEGAVFTQARLSSLEETLGDLPVEAGDEEGEPVALGGVPTPLGVVVGSGAAHSRCPSLVRFVAR